MANTYKTDLTNNNNDLQDILDAINSLPAAVKVQSNKTVSAQPDQSTLVLPSEGYDAMESVTIDPIPLAQQETPTISVDSAGVITSRYSHGSGYVRGTTHVATYSLSTQAATTITPSTVNQTIASGKYLTGKVTIAGDADLVASNIKSGVNIFNVTGTYTGTAPQIFESSNQSDFDAAGSGGTVLFSIPTSLSGKTIHYISFSFQADHARLGTANYSIYWPYKGDTSKVGVGALSCAASMNNTTSGKRTLSFDITRANSNFNSRNFYFDYGVVIYS